MKRINKIACELEGAWDNNEPLNAHEDGSVSYEEYNNDNECDECYDDSWNNLAESYEHQYCYQDEHFEESHIEEIKISNKLLYIELIENNKITKDNDCLCDCCNNECDHRNEWTNDHMGDYYDGCMCNDGSSYYFAGESNSNPCSSIRDLVNYVNENYPDHHDSTCGLHLHISFKSPVYYAVLVSEKFYDNLMKFYKSWLYHNNINSNSRAFKRLEGNRYCENKFNLDEINQQIECNHKSDYRYRVLNYCWNLHGTLELRFLNIFDQQELTNKCIKDLVKWIDNYCDLEYKRLKNLDFEIIAEKPTIKETIEKEII